MSTSSIVRGAHDRSAPTRRRAVVLALTTASLLIAGCGDSSSAPSVVSSKVLADAVPDGGALESSPSTSDSPTASPSDARSIADLVAGVEAELRAHPGQTLLLTSIGDVSMAPGVTFRGELYVDIEIGVARQTLRQGGAAGTTVWLDEDWLVVQEVGGNVRTVPAAPCDGMSVVIGVLLACEPTGVDVDITLETSEDGEPVVVMAASVPQQTQADPMCTGDRCRMITFTKEYTRRLTLDPVSLLPAHVVEEGSMDLGSGLDYTTQSTYTAEYVDRTSLELGFFTPPPP